MSWFEKLGAIKTASQTLRLRMAKAAQDRTAHDHVMAPRSMPSSPEGAGTGVPRGVFRDAGGREYYASGVGQDRLYTDTLAADPQKRQQQLREFDQAQKRQLAQHRAERIQRQEAWAAEVARRQQAEQAQVQGHPQQPQAQPTEQVAQLPQEEAQDQAVDSQTTGQVAQAPQGPQSWLGRAASAIGRRAQFVRRAVGALAGTEGAVSRAAPPPDLGQTFSQGKMAAEYDQRSGVWRNTGRNNPGNGNDAIHQTPQTTSTQAIGNGLTRRSCAPAAKLGAAVVRSIQRREDRSEPT